MQGWWAKAVRTIFGDSRLADANAKLLNCGQGVKLGGVALEQEVGVECGHTKRVDEEHYDCVPGVPSVGASVAIDREVLAEESCAVIKVFALERLWRSARAKDVYKSKQEWVG